jgi:hypothetical protein
MSRFTISAGVADDPLREVGLMANRIKFDAKKKDEFLKLLRETANATRSCKAVDISYTCYWEHLKSDPEFRMAVNEAYESAGDVLEQEARRRALEGIDKPVFYKGEVCGLVKQYSDTLLIFLLKAAKPNKYAERIAHKIDPKAIDSLIEKELGKLAARASSDIIDSDGKQVPLCVNSASSVD